MPRDQEIKFEDAIRGWVSVSSNHIDDKVIFKSDGMPTYHLANVVDDFLMKISHVVRGEEWLPSTPLHVYLYQCLGWETSMPIFAHLPLILKPDGNGKLSKRDGDRLGFPVFPITWKNGAQEAFHGYREQGFISEAFVNMLAFLGWNPGTEQEVFTLTELITEFSLSRVGKSGAKYDFSKTKWFNQQHLRNKSSQDIFEALIKTDGNMLSEFSKDYVVRVIDLVKERATFEKDVLVEGEPFFLDKVVFSEKALTKKWNTDFIPHLMQLTEEIYNIEDFEPENIEANFHDYLKRHGVSLGKIMPMLRISITGSLAGPSMFQALSLIGKEKMRQRVSLAIKHNQ